MLNQPPKQHQLHNRISWPDLYFTAEATREAFEDVVVVTLKSDFVDRVYDRAIKEVGLKSQTRLSKRAYEIIQQQEIKVQERVEITKAGMKVIVNCNEVNEAAVWRALDMLAQALDVLEGKVGTVPFGESVSFETTEIVWLHTH